MIVLHILLNGGVFDAHLLQGFMQLVDLFGLELEPFERSVQILFVDKTLGLTHLN